LVTIDNKDAIKLHKGPVINLLKINIDNFVILLNQFIRNCIEKNRENDLKEIKNLILVLIKF
jgi:hypothetical protein